MPTSNLEAPPEQNAQPGADVTTNTGPRLPADQMNRRLALGAAASLAINIAAFSLLAQVVRGHITPPLSPITFKRIFLPPPPKPKHRHIPKPPPRPKVKPKPLPMPKPIAKPKPMPQVVHHARPPAAHHNILTSKGPTVATHTALPGGNAQLGQPIANQNPGQGSDNNAPPTPKPVPIPVPISAPTPPAPKPAPAPAPPAPKPQPSGPTQDAQPTHQVLPDIPDDLKSEDYQSSVRVKVEIKADGSATANLLTSSGNLDVDQRVLDALKRWKWKPALQNGQPIDSTQRFRFNFDVQ